MKPRGDLAVDSADGELIVLDKNGGKVHQLNASAAVVWSGLESDLGLDEIASELSGAFDIEPEAAISDVRAAIAQFTELGLLEG